MEPNNRNAPSNSSKGSESKSEGSHQGLGSGNSGQKPSQTSFFTSQGLLENQSGNAPFQSAFTQNSGSKGSFFASNPTPVAPNFASGFSGNSNPFGSKKEDSQSSQSVPKPPKPENEDEDEEFNGEFSGEDSEDDSDALADLVNEDEEPPAQPFDMDDYLKNRHML